jgi:hypothetical protein
VKGSASDAELCFWDTRIRTLFLPTAAIGLIHLNDRPQDSNDSFAAVGFDTHGAAEGRFE